MAREEDPPRAVGVEEAALLLKESRAAPRLVVAVSGGPDSVALLHLAHLVGRAGRLPPIVAATVDHGLRPTSAEVAAGVLAQARGLGLDAHLLRWDGPKPPSGLQAAARDARYRLLDDLALRLGGADLLTAHTLDDQAETILFRMARGSGPAGLGAMRASVTRRGVIHRRPFLGLGKARLIETCRARGWAFVEDPSNRDPRFARARLRRLLPLLAGEGLDAATLALLGRRLARDEEALSGLAGRLLDRAGPPPSEGRRRLDAATLLRDPPAIASRALSQALSGLARTGPPRLARLERLEEALRHAHAAGRTLRRTLHGLVVSLDASGIVEIVPEGARRRGGTPGDKDER